MHARDFMLPAALLLCWCLLSLSWHRVGGSGLLPAGDRSLACCKTGEPNGRILLPALPEMDRPTLEADGRSDLAVRQRRRGVALGAWAG